MRGALERYRLLAAWPILAAVLLLRWSVDGGAVPVPVAHPEGETCGTCHMAGEGVNLANAARLVDREEALCGRCHSTAVTSSHPTGFTPGRPIDAAFPLSPGGELTCSSCHLVHGAGKGKLRGERRGRDLCESCHRPAFFAAMIEGGTSIGDLGHLAGGGGATVGDGLDETTRQCLECHMDGLLGAAMYVDHEGILRHAGQAFNHPVGVSYRRVEGQADYRPVSLVSRAVRLPEGRVACISCHKGYTRRHGQLVMSNNGSRLCFECHRL